MAWTADQVAKLRTYVAAGLSGGGIAKALRKDFPGCGYTRCAVGAKVDRLGLHLGGASKSPAKGQEMAIAGRRAAKARRGNQVSHFEVQNAAVRAAAPVALVDLSAFPHALPFLNAKNGECRFILNDPRDAAAYAAADAAAAADGVGGGSDLLPQIVEISLRALDRALAVKAGLSHRMSALAIAALDLAKRDIAVFPLKPREKRPLSKNGFHDASARASVIAQQWRRHPDANIGAATGAVSGFWVLDIDGAEAAAWLVAWEQEYGPLPVTVQQKTSRGVHYCFAWPEQCAPGEGVRCSVAKLGPHVDVRSCGGYIVVAPSIHPSGHVYEWVAGRSPADVPFALAPAWLWDAAFAVSSSHAAPVEKAAPYVHERAPSQAGTSRYGEAALANACNAIASAPVGARDITLWKKCCAIGCLVAGGEIAAGAARAALINAGLSMAPGKDRIPFKIVESAVRRAFEWAQGYPRAAPNREAERKPRPAVWTRPIVQENEGQIPDNGLAHSDTVCSPALPPMPDDLAGFLTNGARDRKHALGVGRMGGTFVSSRRARKRRKFL